MNQINSGPNQADVDARYRVLLIIWSAFLVSEGLFFLITVLAAPPAGGGENRMLLLFLMIAAAAILFISFWLKRIYLNQSVVKQRPEIVRVAYIVSWAMLELIVLIGVITHFLLPNTSSYYYLLIIAALGILFQIPRRDHLLAATYKAKIG